ncbi:hypothetical protein [Fuchsiella alkaliacetigena]|uniref:hypothetical protein n=1 Tax=Fuchsiella alkaliacetigena TaxID=957042 RepID=UPI00200B78F1|nr:hypothetical protein [Fuchsiella alkaliacetigena]MCK8824306.1 hypothetical protein [Fuchsiella alkaliacetigena]
MRKLSLLIVMAIFLTITATTPTLASTDWTLEALGGVVYNLETVLRIEEEDGEEIKIDRADYATRPFDTPLYYSLRVARWKDNAAWEFEFIHHKLYLETEHEDIDNFEVTHGYNIFTINRAWNINNFDYRLGAGMVLAHPDVTMAGEERFVEEGGILDTGYYLTGPALQAAVSRRFELTEKLFATVEGKATSARAVMPISEEGEEARVPNLALHGLFGIGYKF